MWRRRLTDLAMVFMESISLYVLACLLAGIGGRPGPAPVTMPLAAFGGFGLARTLQRFDLSERVLIGVGAAISLFGIWLLGAIAFAGAGGPQLFAPLQRAVAEPTDELNRNWPEIAGLVVLAITWLRGVLAAARPVLTQPALLGPFTVGLGIMMLGLTFGRSTVSSQELQQAALPFFMAGLLALALLNLSQSEHIQGDSWRGPWLLVLASTIGALALLAVAVGLLRIGAVNALLATVDALLLLLVDLLIYAIALPVVVVLNWLLVHLLAGHLHPIQIPPPSFSPERRPHPPAHPSGLTLVLLDLGHAVIIIAAVGAAALALWWVFTRVKQPPPAGVETRESVEHDLGLGADVRAILAALRRHARPGPRTAEPALSPRLRTLRRLYLEILRRSAARGLPRPDGTTPKEFAPALAERLDTPSAEDLSHRFSAGRYGLIEPSDQELEELRERVQDGR